MNVSFMKGTATDIFKNKNNIADGSFIFAEDTKKLYIKMGGMITSVTRGAKTKSNCVNCGAPLKIPDLYSAIVKCEFCGTYQDIDDNIDLGKDEEEDKFNILVRDLN